MIARLLGALQFLTVVPVHGHTAPPGASAMFFPLIGAGIGALVSAVFYVIGAFADRSLAAWAALLVGVLVTGGLHEDGLADVADAFRAGRSPQRMLAILRDSRIGTYGALALLFSVLFRWRALCLLGPSQWKPIVAAYAGSRAAMVLLAYVSRPVGYGLGGQFSQTLTTGGAVGAVIFGLAGVGLMGWLGAAQAMVWLAAVLRLAHYYFHQRLGGVTGDCLGATEQVAQGVLLGVGLWEVSI